MFLQLNDITKQYGNKEILRKISFGVPAETTLSILGKSGCGKSTLLRIIAGIEPANSGSILLRQKDITSLGINLRNIVYLFQEALLFPHLNVFENIAFGLRLRNLPKDEITARVTEMLLNLELVDEAKKKTNQLSGGQKQRVAFGRALIINPPLMLLDEPFSSLDAEVRTNMQQLYKKMAAQYKCTALFITHDLKEALLMGDNIAYMENGTLQIFNSKQQFIEDKRTGVENEKKFWNSLK